MTHSEIKTRVEEIVGSSVKDAADKSIPTVRYSDFFKWRIEQFGIEMHNAGVLRAANFVSQSTANPKISWADSLRRLGAEIRAIKLPTEDQK